MKRQIGKKGYEMKNKIVILGYYKRKKDSNEYIHYTENGKEYLTSGVHKWSDREKINNRYIPQLTKVDTINFIIMAENLKRYFPYDDITAMVLTKLN